MMGSRTWLDSLCDAVAALARWLAGLDWLTAGAFLLTIGSFLGAVLDSYTSLCVIGATQGRIGSVAACPDVHGWDTRTFPLSVDMGWGGALLAVVRLAHTIGIGSWRWWAVLGFEVLTAAFTVAGNAFHGAVLDGATAGLAGSTLAVVISSVASAVPGVVAVGSGFTLSVLVSTPRDHPRGEGRQGDKADRKAPPVAARELPDRKRPLPVFRSGRMPAREVEALVKTVRTRLIGKLGREPSGEEVAAEMTKDGHSIHASRARTYLARVRAEERKGPTTEPNAEEEVVAWHGR
jgi:hypothetical protein